MPRRSAPLRILILVALAGCGAEPGPEAAWRAWIEDLQAGRTEAAFDRLASTSRQELEQAEALWRAGGSHPLLPPGEAPPPPAARPGLALFERLLHLQDGTLGVLPADAPERIGPAIVEGDRARVSVRTPIGTREAWLLSEDGRWGIWLRPAPR
jgi:hypothetical protein